MERPRGFFTKRSEHFNNIQKEENNKKRAIEESLIKETAEKKVKQEQQSPTPKVENLDPNKVSQSKNSNSTQKKVQIKHERPLKCLETLAQKAGITFDEKYDMEKSQSPSQVQTMQAQSQPALQITQEQYQQLQQQLQLQQAFANSQGATIHVKQEFQTQQQQQQPQGITAADLKQLQDQHQLQQMQIVQAEQSQSSQQHANNQAAAQALQQAVQNGQVPAEWQQQRVQVLQQPMQNAQYLQQQLYSPQLVMSGNILHHSGLGQQQQIQLIAAGKPFQNQLTQQMLAGGKTVSGFGGYTMPSIPTSNSQTVLFSPVSLNGVIGSQSQQQQTQQNIMSNMQQQTPTKSEQKPITGKNILQKVSQAQTSHQHTVSGSVANQNSNMQSVQVSQQTMPTAQLLSGQTMQFAAPWITQAGTMTTPFWNQLHQPIQLASPILIRGTNPDGTPTFIQQSPNQQTQQTVLSPLNQIPLVGNISAAQQQSQSPKVRPANEGPNKTQTTPQRAPTILPQGAQIRPASSVSTQTAINQNATLIAKTPKVRTKQTPVRPAVPNIKVSLNQQTGQPTMMQQVVTQGGVNKMVVMSSLNGQLTPVLQQNTQQIMTADKMKTQQQQQQQVILQQMANIQQQQNAAVQQHNLQQQIAQQFQLQQQHQHLFNQAQAQGIQNQLMAAQQAGNIQQVVLQQHQQLPTVTVASVTMPLSTAKHVFTSQNSVTIPTSIASTSIAGQQQNSADTSSSILGPLSSPQTPLQPPQNPLIAMKTLSASPMSGMSSQKEKSDASTGDSNSARSSPMKRSADDSKTNDAKKQATEEKKEESVSTTSPVKTPAASPSTPNSTTKPPAVNSPLAVQNGEAESMKTTNGSLSMLKNEVPKAMVKPNVLTHIIEGFVIQESDKPFPVTRQRYSEKENDEPSKKTSAEDAKADSAKVNGESSGTSTPNVTSSTSTPLPTDMVACEHCSKQEMRSKLKKKRFCSMACARARKSSSTDGSSTITAKGDEKSHVESSPVSNNNNNNNHSISDKTKTDENGDLPSIEEHIMMKWSVAQVCDFIKNLPGCSDYAEDFKLQEIDGQALLLLKENHLVSAMNMKLGPALKIVNKIESMRVTIDGENSESPPDHQ